MEISKLFDLADKLELNVASEWHHFWIVIEASRAVLPSHIVRTSGGAFANEISGKVVSKNPTIAVFKNLLDRYRKVQPHPTAGSGKWMFVENEEEDIYVNVVTKATSTHGVPAGEALLYHPPRFVFGPPIRVLQCSSRVPNGRFVNTSITHLTFRSWWKDYSDKIQNHLTLRYDLSSGSFRVSFERRDSRKDSSYVASTYASSSATCRQGPVRAWNLFVGNRIKLFGRWTTLRQANGETTEWIDRHGRHLVRLRSDLERELRKHVVVPKTKSPPFRVGGKTDLATLLGHVEELKRMLERVAPKRARDMIARSRLSEPFVDLLS